MFERYKIAIIGFGSIGTRHFDNITSVLKERTSSFAIDLIRSGNGKALIKDVEKHINHTYSISDSIPNDYDAIFVANPTHLHYSTIQQFSTHTKNMFIEKPVFDTTNISIDDLQLNGHGQYYVACPLRYTSVIQYMKNLCEQESVLCARTICSSYLPDWRPDQNYESTYSAHIEQGGGVSIDLIHEWDYLCYLFGQPEQVFNISGKFSKLNIDCEDVSLYIAKYPHMAVEIHLDYFGRKPIREIQVFTDKDTIVGDLINSEIRYLKSGEVVSVKQERNDFYRKEIEHFFDIIQGEVPNDNNIDMALQTLKLAKVGRLR